MTLLELYDAGVRLGCLLAAIVFVVRFSRVDWRATIEGRHLMRFSFMLILFLTLVALVIIIGRQPWYAWVARIAFTWMLFLLIERSVIQKRAQDEAELIVKQTPEVNHPPLSDQSEKGQKWLLYRSRKRL